MTKAADNRLSIATHSQPSGEKQGLEDGGSFLDYINKPVSEIESIGSRSIQKLLRLNIRYIKDLLFHFPRHHQRFETNSTSQNQCLRISVEACLSGSKYTLIKAKTLNNAQNVSMFFHKKQYAYLRHRMKHKSCWVVWGKASFDNHAWTLFFPKTTPLTQETHKVDEIIYGQTEGLKSSRLHAWISRALEKMPPSQEWLPPSWLETKNWSSFETALRHAHYLGVTSTQQHSKALERLSFDRVLARQILFSDMKRLQSHKKAFACTVTSTRFQDALRTKGFTLTPSQKEAYQEISQDLKSSRPMKRLLQGDVGSGKTLVALGAIAQTIDAKKRVAYLAPTEILADQIYRTYHSLFADTITCCALLTKGSSHKKQHIQDIAFGKYDVIIGTHALLREDVTIPDLGLVIIDEQQRFGVAQRAHLITQEKHTPHLLLMTATPIPRTYNLMIKGDVDTSYLKARFLSQRKTQLLDKENVNLVIHKVDQALKRGKQIFWICARVDAGSDKVAVKERFDQLKTYFNDQVGCIYGSQTSQEKEQTLSLFRQGRINLLIATTVVEIGIDVPQASHMIIEDIQQFGLSQLHQLRGRIGRLGQQSFLLGLYQTPLSKHAHQRLSFFKKYDDGFDIAQQDLLLRGEGDIAGIYQSGFLDPRFSFNTHMLKDAQHVEKQLCDQKKAALLDLFEKHPETDFLNVA